MKTLEAVVPVYNEEAILPELNRRLVDALGRLPYEWRIIYVDDGSRDRTPDLLADFAAADSRVAVVHLSRNFGQQLAISAGLAATSADAVVLLDGDLQDPPEVVPLLVEKWEDGYDVVYALKRERKEAWPKRVLFNLFYRVLRRLSSVDIPADAGNFSLMDRSVVDMVNKMPERDRYVSGLRAYVGGRQTGVEFERAARYAGQPRQSPLKLMRMATDALFAFSELPLRLATFMGFLVSGVAFLVLVSVLYQKLVSGAAILGWASTMTSILFLGGIQLIAVGVIGEYIGRIYNEAKGRPAWVVGRYRNLSGAATDAARPLHDERDSV
ncbi:MAG: glycosyltransferase family 2 protein [Gemmatimonadetes bacterium]|nr:glycosyltransferase family 2 protein [Gemmatimonadota bacterium]MBT8479057.1 glycosyltransferase family 2 protein [Gemmatimonadota bacterium]NNK49891.1 glycosyltransferase family 2 protein [Gemmatimonadota bacterium]